MKGEGKAARDMQEEEEEEESLFKAEEEEEGREAGGGETGMGSADAGVCGRGGTDSSSGSVGGYWNDVVFS